ncbi:MAG: hypothetical protein OEW09_13780 [Anaerolineae bacterium]|nr:hypothetical protein [Anaerolineae bacterium]
MRMTMQVIGLGRNLIIATLVGLVVGCLFGWMVVGWLVMPVKWELTPAEKEQYILMAADSYALNGDDELARARLADLDDEEIGELIGRLAATHPQEQQNLLNLGLVLGLEVTEAIPQPTVVATTPPTTVKLTSSLGGTLPIACGVIILLLFIAIGGLLVTRLRGRREEAEALAPAWQPGVPAAAGAMPSLAFTGPPPLEHFVTTYGLGHDTYDESFSIETPMGEFLGECGVGISETLGAGEPARVTAFEVWLFDKSDIRTITKVLMSQYAYSDDALRTKLAPKGDHVLAELGKDMVLETTSLRVDARVVDMEYDGEAMPPQSQFTKLTVELVARPIESGGGPGGIEGMIT